MSRESRSTRATSETSGSPHQSDEWTNRRASEQATRAANARQQSGRRRFVDPTTSEREYTAAEMEFMMAMNAYKQRSGRMFPTWSEVLEVLRSLGYEKIATEASCPNRGLVGASAGVGGPLRHGGKPLREAPSGLA
jgi:hypothetical protein